MGWIDDQGYQRVPGLTNFIKSYLQSGQMTKDTNGYLVLQILPSPTYGVDRQSRIPTESYLANWTGRIVSGHI